LFSFTEGPPQKDGSEQKACAAINGHVMGSWVDDDGGKNCDPQHEQRDHLSLRSKKWIRHRTRVVGAFPDGQSCLNLAAARLRYIAATAWSTKRYMNMRPLYQPQIMQTGAVA
jgi:hypothetical protein